MTATDLENNSTRALDLARASQAVMLFGVLVLMLAGNGVMALAVSSDFVRRTCVESQTRHGNGTARASGRPFDALRPIYRLLLFVVTDRAKDARAMTLLA